MRIILMGGKHHQKFQKFFLKGTTFVVIINLKKLHVIGTHNH